MIFCATERASVLRPPRLKAVQDHLLLDSVDVEHAFVAMLGLFLLLGGEFLEYFAYCPSL